MPDFGNTTAPATALSVEGQLWGLNASPISSGTTDSISAYVRETSADNTHQFQVGLYNAAGTSLLGNSATAQNATTTASWKTVTLSGISVTGGTSYGICLIAGGGGGSLDMYYDTGSGLSTWGNAITFPTWPATLTAGNTTRNWGIYTTYTESGASIPIGVVALSVAGFAESLLTQLPIGVGSFVVTGFAPNLVQNIVLPVSAGSLAINGLSPTLSQILTLSTGSFSVQGFSLSLDKTIPLVVGSLTVNGLTQSLQQSVILSIGAGLITVTGFALTLTANLDLSNPSTISVTGFVPATTFGAQTISIGTGTIVLSGRIPTVVVSGIGIPQASVTISGLSASLVKQIPIGSVDVLAQGFAPSLHNIIAINIGQIVIAGRIPTLQTSVSNVAIGAGAMAISGYVQTLIAGTPVINMFAGSMSIVGLVPGIEQLLLIRNTDSRSDNTLTSKRTDTTHNSRRTST